MRSKTNICKEKKLLARRLGLTIDEKKWISLSQAASGLITNESSLHFVLSQLLSQKYRENIS